MDEILEIPEYYDIIPEYNSDGRICNYHTGEGETVRVMADEWERFNQLAGRQHEVIDGIVIYNDSLKPCLPDGVESPLDLKLTELSAASKTAITNGCDVTLSDGTTAHYALAETDQINISTALAAVQQGAQGFPYHADGELCRLYPAADIVAISNAAAAHKLYHTTYFNHLKAWVNRLETAEEISAVTYGSELPEDLAKNMEDILNAASV